MCIRDSVGAAPAGLAHLGPGEVGAAQIGFIEHRRGQVGNCLLYTSDAADERSSVDLGGRRIIKKKQKAHSGRNDGQP